MYTLEVTNPGVVAFPASAVGVIDENCDDAPELVSKANDSTPETLDPGDMWAYRCSHGTTAGAQCEPMRVDNPGVGSATAGGATVTDDDTISTILLCPDQPTPPRPEPPNPPGPNPPGPTPPGPVAPPGPPPPEAGAAGTASVARLPSCVHRGSVVSVRGARIASVRVFVGHRRIRGLSVRPLQERALVRVTRRLKPGRCHVTARVTFRHGAATPPVVLRRLVHVCGRVAAPVTG